MGKKTNRKGLVGPYLILMGSDSSDCSWAMDRLGKADMELRLAGVNLAYERRKEELLVEFIHISELEHLVQVFEILTKLNIF